MFLFFDCVCVCVVLSLSLLQTIGFYIKDKIKKFFVFTALTLAVTSLLIYIVQWGGEYLFLYAWLFCGTVMLVSLVDCPVYFNVQVR